MATTISRASLNDDTGDGESGDVWNAALVGTAIYDKIDALIATDPIIFNSIVLTTAVSTWGNRLKYDGANQLFIGVPGTTTAKKVTFIDSAGNPVATINGVGDGLLNGSILSTSPSGGVGYTAGAGGTVTQITSKTTGVTLNKITGQITMHNAALAGGASVVFSMTNSAVGAADVVAVNIMSSSATANAYDVAVIHVQSGTVNLRVTNITAGSLSEAPIIGFTVMKGSTT